MPEVSRLSTAEVSADLLAAIHQLLIEAFDGDFSDEDWAHTLGGWHSIVTDGGAVVAHAAVVPRLLDAADRTVRTGYVEGVATAPDRQGEGLGSLAMDDAAALLRDRFEMGALSTSRHSFYERLGWQRWHGPTFVRDGARTVRTEDEDDGIMVLRFGHSAGVDLAAPLTCEARPGDDW